MTERSRDGQSKPLLPMPCFAAAGTRPRCFPARKSLLRDSRQKMAPTKPTAASSHSPTAKSCLSAPQGMGKDRRSSSWVLRSRMEHGPLSMFHWAHVMITGAHSIIYSTNPEADRAFLRDVLHFLNVVLIGRMYLHFSWRE